MDWYQIIGAAFLVGMFIYIFPRAKQMLLHSPKAEAGDWQAVILPLVLVVGFIAILVMMVRN